MTRAQTVLAFDFGLKRIGIACGDTLTRSAAPRPAAAAVRGNPDWQAIAREVRALTPGFLVVGAPYNVDGSEGGSSAASRYPFTWSMSASRPWRRVRSLRRGARAGSAGGACSARTSTAPPRR